MRKTRRIDVDTRGVAIYARKSRITNKGDSIGVQFKQCAEYAKKELRLDDDFAFMEYEDKGMSGYFSDRPDFQRMLRDVEAGKIRAIVCYKLDRVGRKTTDLLRLMDFLEKYNVDLLICSNGINTASGFSKIFIQIFAVIAEKTHIIVTPHIMRHTFATQALTGTGVEVVQKMLGHSSVATTMVYAEVDQSLIHIAHTRSVV